MAYSPPTGDAVDFDFNDALESPPANFDFYTAFDYVPPTPIAITGVTFQGVTFN
jgi:hypothetical protein